MLYQNSVRSYHWPLIQVLDEPLRLPLSQSKQKNVRYLKSTIRFRYFTRCFKLVMNVGERQDISVGSNFLAYLVVKVLSASQTLRSSSGRVDFEPHEILVRLVIAEPRRQFRLDCHFNPGHVFVLTKMENMLLESRRAARPVGKQR